MPPIDPSIILGARPAQIQQPDQFDALNKSLTLKALLGQQQLQGLQVQQAQQANTDDQAVRSAYQSGAGDISRIRQILGQGGQYKALQALDTYDLAQQAKRAEIDKNRTASAVSKAKLARDSAAGVSDQPSYDQWRKDTGATTAPATYDPAWMRKFSMDADHFIAQTTPKPEKVDQGGTVGIVDMNPGTNPSAIGTVLPKTLSPGEIQRDTTTRRGQDMTDARSRDANGILADGKLDPHSEAMAQAIANGQLAPLSGWALNKPGGRALMTRVMEINPQYRGQDYGVGLAAERAFTSGKQGQSVRSFNVALAHLDTLSQLADALNNGNTPLVNKLGNAIATQTGGAAPASFEAARKIVGDEITKAIIGSGGGVADRQEAAAKLAAASSPAQLTGVINTYKELMKGQLGGLRQQYETSTNKTDFDKFLSPEARQTMGGAAQPAEQSVKSLPDPAQHKGFTAKDTKNGITYISDGTSWRRQQ